MQLPGVMCAEERGHTSSIINAHESFLSFATWISEANEILAAWGQQVGFLQKGCELSLIPANGENAIRTRSIPTWITMAHHA